ncbi:MAG: hypothetical protein ABTQ29_04005 [Siculibacillus sp.]
MKVRRFAAVLLSIACSTFPALAQTLPGDWNWGVGGGVTVISPDGTGNDGRGNTMRWTLVDAGSRRYRLVWSHGYTDDAALSADGNSLTVVNNVGMRFTSVRRAPATPPAAPGGGSTAAWTSLRPNSGETALTPLGETGFRPGRYVILIANADPDGHVVRTWKTHGPFDVRPGDHWIATATASAGLQLEKGAPVTAVGADRAAFGARNADVGSWQAICVLPEGRPPRPTCFAGSGSVRDGEAAPTVTVAPQPQPGVKPPPAAAVTFSRWKAITPDPRQSVAQPGKVMPLEVVGDSQFRVGRYRVHVADAGPHGLTITSWKSFGPMEFNGRERWAAILQSGVRVRMDRNGADTAAYAEPDAEHAMVWARNDDAGTWLAICVLPEGMPVVPTCFAGGRITAAPKATRASCEGTVEFRNPEMKGPIVARLRFTVDGTKIEGSALMRSRSATLERLIDTSLVGTFDGEKITGRLEGRSEGRTTATGGDRNAGPGALAAGAETFPITGAWAGTLKNGTARGTHLVDKGGPNPVQAHWFGTWQAKCR